MYSVWAVSGCLVHSFRACSVFRGGFVGLWVVWGFMGLTVLEFKGLGRLKDLGACGVEGLEPSELSGFRV